MSDGVVTRVTSAQDAAFIARMLAEAASWDRPAGTPPPPVAAVLEDPRCADYVEGWGREGDAGIVAVLDGRSVGACWLRRFTGDHPGYGFLGEDIPGVGIAVLPAHRGVGIGGVLLDETVALARANGATALSLSVSTANRVARSLYEGRGFVLVDTEGGSLTMRLDLDPATQPPPGDSQEPGVHPLGMYEQ